MTWRNIGRSSLRRWLEANGTHHTKVERILAAVNGNDLKVAEDGRFTVVTDGVRVGCAKRCTYARRSDEPRSEVGISVAASRMVQP